MPSQEARRIRRRCREVVRVIDRWLDYQRSFHRIPALSVGIVHGDEVIFRRGYGHRDVRTGQNATETTCYRIASISKTFTATAVLQLVERGTVRLDEKVRRYVPWFRSPRERRLEMITVRQLLAHTAGVERDGFAHWTDDQFPTVERLKACVRDGVSVYTPLERWKYSNLGYAILGQVIESVSGQSYADYVRVKILEPLRLTHTSAVLTPDITRALAVGYGRDTAGRPREAFGNPETHALRSAAGLVSNAVDLCTYMAAQFPGTGRLLTDLSKWEMQRPQWLLKVGGQYGLGYHIWTVGGTSIVGHGGGFQGFKTAIGMDTGTRIGVVVLTNAIDGPAQPLMLAIFRTILDHMDRAERPGPSPKARIDLHKYEGRFATRWSDLEIVALGDRLVGYDASSDRPLCDAHDLVHQHHHHFRITAGPEAGYIGEDVTFLFDGKKELIGLRWGPNPMRRVRRVPAGTATGSPSNR